MINFFSGFVVPDSAATMKEAALVRRQLREKYPNADDADREYKLWQAQHPYGAGTAEIIIDHIDHVVREAGIDSVGLGSDYDGIAKLPVGIEDVSTYPVLTELLLRRGYHEEDIHKIMSGNILRVLKAADRVKEEFAKK